MTPDRQRLLRRLAATPARIAAATERRAAMGRSVEQASAPGEWSVTEVVRHLVAVEAIVWQARLDDLAGTATGAGSPEWSWLEPGPWSGPGDETFASALEVFATRRAATLARLDALDNAGWGRIGRHQTYGLLDVAGLIRLALDHDEGHLAQVAAA